MSEQGAPLGPGSGHHDGARTRAAAAAASAAHEAAAASRLRRAAPSRRARFGLRAQIVLSLFVALALAVALLAIATVRLTSAAARAEEERAIHTLAAALAAALVAVPADPATVRAVIDPALERGRMAGAVVTSPSGAAVVVGSRQGAAAIVEELADGRRLMLWADPSAPRAFAPLANLLSFYVAVTGVAILTLAYFALTHLIVRPLGRLTEVSEQLAQGSLDARAPEEGAAEVARLSGSLNDMAAALRVERQALVARLRDLERRTEELKATQAQLIHGEKLASVGRLAAGVAHEIGNPLAAILGLVELLRQGGLPEGQSEEFLVRIQGETERIHRIIRDLLDFARRDPETQSAAQRADLTMVVQEAVALVRPQKLSRQVAIEIDLPEELGQVRAEPGRLTQVVVNLLLNALDALQGSGRIRVLARRAGALVVLAVEDDGPGIAPEIRERLFEPFTTTKPVGQGTGLGLAVSLALVQSMGGSLAVRDVAPHGACFEISLPLATLEPG